MLTPILFVRPASIYKDLGYDCYDIERDARLYNSNRSIVAHPPCRAWGKLKHFAKPRIDEKNLAIYAINLIRRVGGVLEHPSGSSLFKEMGISLNGSTDQYGGFVISIQQSWFGHRAAKRTYLYICGITKSLVPQLPLCFDAITHAVSSNRSNPQLIVISKKEREETPVLLAKWLISIAVKCNGHSRNRFLNTA